MTIDDEHAWERAFRRDSGAFDVVTREPISVERARREEACLTKEAHLIQQYERGLYPIDGAPDTGNPKDRLGDTKPQLHLVPPALEILASQAMADGAAKYGPYNWREKPVRYTVYISAIKRHLAALLDGEDLTRDSKVPHLGAIAASVAILADAQATGTLIDDRSSVPGPAGDLLDKYTRAS